MNSDEMREINEQEIEQILSYSDIKRCKDAFDELDVDENLKISPKELEIAMKSLIPA